jgi:hypothetical protein
MPKLITDDNGDEIEVFTAEEAQAQAEKVKAEYEAKLAEKDAHVKEKLDQFQKAKGGIDLEKEEIMKKLELETSQAKQLAEQANLAIAQANKAREDMVKEYWIKSVVGEDADAIAKINSNFEMINLEIKSEEDIKRKVEMATNMAGINKINVPHSPFIGGGYAPNPAKDPKNNADYQQFLKDTGLDNMLK